MATMNTVRLSPEEVPLKLYRVNCPDTWVKYVPEFGFKAADTSNNDFASEMNKFWAAMIYHLRPGSGVKSPFISLFGKKKYAEGWARRWEEDHDNKKCELVEIEGAKLKDCYLFHPYPQGVSGCELSEYFCLHWIPETAIISRRSTSDVRADGELQESEQAHSRPSTCWSQAKEEDDEDGDDDKEDEDDWYSQNSDHSQELPRTPKCSDRYDDGGDDDDDSDYFDYTPKGLLRTTHWVPEYDDFYTTGDEVEQNNISDDNAKRLERDS